jgi:protein O-GlcNAc transferase
MIRPVDSGAELRRALQLQSQGHSAEADRCLLRVLEQDPVNFDALHMRGVLAAQAGRLDEAAASLRRAVALRPNVAVVQLNLSAVLIDMRQFDAALDYAERALALQRDSMQALLNRAAALRGLGRLGEARDAYELALARDAGNGLAPRLHGDLLLELGEPGAALASYERAVQLTPSSAEAHAGRGMTLLQLQRPREALASYQRALGLDTAGAAVFANCAAAQLALGRAADALVSCDRALALQPEFFEAHYNRASALLALYRCGAAVAAYDRALALRPQSAAALCGRGQACREMADRQGAYESYRRALHLEPDSTAARVGLVLTAIPVIPASTGEVETSRLELATEFARFDAWVSASPGASEPDIVAHTPSFYLAYQEQANRELLAAWGSLACGLMARWAARTPVPAAPPNVRTDSRVRVGFVTAHAYEQSVFRALLRGWLEYLDKDRIHATVFDLGTARSAANEWARAHAEWVECSELALAECVEEIHRRDVEVLIYPEIGMHGRTLQLASLRLARHQIAAWGHPETTGLPTIDHFVSSEAFESAGSQQYYSEQLVRLPGIGCCYEPYEVTDSPPPGLPGTAVGVPLLVSAGMPFKYSPEHDAVLVEIAQRLGRCRIVLFESSQAELSRRMFTRLRAAFHRAGLDPEHYLAMLPWCSLEAFYGLLRRADVYLDTLGFSGFNTVMHAVACQLPVVAYEGRFMRGRFASGVLRCLGLDEFVATTQAEYVQLASALACHADLRDQVRGRLAANRHRLYRDRASVDALSDFLVRLAR